MAITPSRATAGNPAVILAENTRSAGDTEARTTRHVLKNMTRTATVYLGGQGVTDATGFAWESEDGAYEVELEPGEKVYGYAAVNQTIHVLSGGR